MSMVLFQGAFYANDFGLSANAAAAILLWPRLWDAAFDPIMGVLADRTETRWGKFRPWVLWTSFPWAVCMVLAYTTPQGWSMGMMIAWAGITNTVLVTLYSMNNMPYSALGGVMTGDLNERTKLNSYRFVAANIAQFIVGGFTLPLVAKFAQGSTRQHGWQMTMTIWAVVCFVLFLVTFFTTKERIKPVVETKSSPKQDFSDLLKNGPWIALFVYVVPLRDAGLPRQRSLQLLPPVRGQGRHVRFSGHAGPHDGKSAAGHRLLRFDLRRHACGYVAHGTRENVPSNVRRCLQHGIINMAGFGVPRLS